MRIIVAEYENRISPLFDGCDSFLVFDVSGGNISEKTKYRVYPYQLFKAVEFCNNENADIIICGAISRYCVRLLATGKAKVLSGIQGDCEKALEAFLNGTINDDQTFLLPCWCRSDIEKENRCRRRKRFGWKP